MSGPGPGYLLLYFSNPLILLDDYFFKLRRTDSFWRHNLLPVLPISIMNQEPDGAPHCFFIPDSAKYLNPIPFYLHPSATTISTLTAGQFIINYFQIYFNSRRQTINNCHQTLTV